MNPETWILAHQDSSTPINTDHNEIDTRLILIVFCKKIKLNLKNTKYPEKIEDFYVFLFWFLGQLPGDWQNTRLRSLAFDWWYICDRAASIERGPREARPHWSLNLSAMKKRAAGNLPSGND